MSYGYANNKVFGMFIKACWKKRVFGFVPFFGLMPPMLHRNYPK